MSFSEDEMQEFKKLMEGVMPGRVVSNFVFVAEMLSEEGTDIEVYLSEAMTPWLARGMLDYADQMITYQVYETEDTGEED